MLGQRVLVQPRTARTAGLAKGAGEGGQVRLLRGLERRRENLDFKLGLVWRGGMAARLVQL